MFALCRGSVLPLTLLAPMAGLELALAFLHVTLESAVLWIIALTHRHIFSGFLFGLVRPTGWFGERHTQSEILMTANMTPKSNFPSELMKDPVAWFLISGIYKQESVSKNTQGLILFSLMQLYIDLNGVTRNWHQCKWEGDQAHTFTVTMGMNGVLEWTFTEYGSKSRKKLAVLRVQCK